MKNITIAANVQKTEAIKEAEKIIRILSEKNITIFLEYNLASQIDGNYVSDETRIWAETDLIITLGGDGTLLNFSKKIDNPEIPILGINLGGLGFLTEFNPKDFCALIDDILKGNFTVEKRMMLEVGVTQNGEKQHIYQALNDIVLSRGDLARMIHVRVEINKQYLTSYSCDGIILSTPTGSTAHSLSAGGPIIVPDAEMIILTPICPHTLSNRPIALSSTSVVSLTQERFRSDTRLTVDGQLGIELKEDDIITINKAAKYISLVTSGYSYFEILRKKLGWKGSHLL